MPSSPPPTKHDHTRLGGLSIPCELIEASRKDSQTPPLSENFARPELAETSLEQAAPGRVPGDEWGRVKPPRVESFSSSRISLLEKSRSPQVELCSSGRVILLESSIAP